MVKVCLLYTTVVDLELPKGRIRVVKVRAKRMKNLEPRLLTSAHPLFSAEKLHLCGGPASLLLHQAWKFKCSNDSC